jgi:hypothetical protein
MAGYAYPAISLLDRITAARRLRHHIVRDTKTKNLGSSTEHPGIMP